VQYGSVSEQKDLFNAARNISYILGCFSDDVHAMLHWILVLTNFDAITIKSHNANRKWYAIFLWYHLQLP